MQEGQLLLLSLKAAGGHLLTGIGMCTTLNGGGGVQMYLCQSAFVINLCFVVVIFL